MLWWGWVLLAIIGVVVFLALTRSNYRAARDMFVRMLEIEKTATDVAIEQARKDVASGTADPNALHLQAQHVASMAFQRRLDADERALTRSSEIKQIIGWMFEQSEILSALGDQANQKQWAGEEAAYETDARPPTTFQKQEHSAAPLRSKSHIEDYLKRPLAPPEHIYPLINSGLEFVFNLPSLNSRNLPIAPLASGNSNQVLERGDERLTAFEKDLSSLERACNTLEAVRMDDSEPLMMQVHLSVEMVLGLGYLYLHHGAGAFLSRMLGNEEEHLAHQQEADKAMSLLPKAVSTLRDDLQRLHDERPEQFAALELSESNLITLDCKHLIG